MTADVTQPTRLTNSRPSPGVQPISGDPRNAGQTEGSAQAAPSPPPGHKLVPREPTQEMLLAWGKQYFGGNAVTDWQAMYDASPAAPVKE